ncbi:MAG: hypothetical protein M9964_00450 [Solirubrobacterales bacterium]|nr:hypothetical protein [Thermoleophilales bacterium]MCO5325523.1 hypothetical protein [Solirubrobacterales bacterium]
MSPPKTSETFQRCSAEVVTAIGDGCSIADAARAAGCDSRTVDRWLSNGRKDPHGPYGRFAAQVEARLKERGMPASEHRAVMDRSELLEIISKAARAGSVAAMRLASELIDDEPPSPGIQRLNEIRERRARRLAAEGLSGE